MKMAVAVSNVQAKAVIYNKPVGDQANSLATIKSLDFVESQSHMMLHQCEQS